MIRDVCTSADEIPLRYQIHHKHWCCYQKTRGLSRTHEKQCLEISTWTKTSQLLKPSSTVLIKVFRHCLIPSCLSFPRLLHQDTSYCDRFNKSYGTNNLVATVKAILFVIVGRASIFIKDFPIGNDSMSVSGRIPQKFLTLPAAAVLLL